MEINIDIAREDMENGVILEVSSLMWKTIANDKTTLKHINEKKATTKYLSNLTYKLKAMQPCLTMNMT